MDTGKETDFGAQMVVYTRNIIIKTWSDTMMELINCYVVMHRYPLACWNNCSFNQYYCYDFVLEMKLGIIIVLITVIFNYPSWKCESLIVFYKLDIAVFDTTVLWLTVYVFVRNSTAWQDIADIYVGDSI